MGGATAFGSVKLPVIPVTAVPRCSALGSCFRGRVCVHKCMYRTLYIQLFSIRTASKGQLSAHYGSSTIIKVCTTGL